MRLHEGQLWFSASDLAAHLGCGHRTQLDRRAALGELKAPPVGADLEVLQQRGLEHENAYLEHLEQSRGLRRVDLRGSPLDASGLEATRRAMREGAGVIAQAPLIGTRFRGIADVLLRTDVPSPAFGDYSYWVVDTKLASETRAGTLLQLWSYSQVVGDIQGVLPTEFWVVSPGGFDSPERFRVSDYAAFARRVERALRRSVDEGGAEEASAPEPVPDCDICRWWSRCERRRREADHLSFVAGISRLQRRELERLEIGTLSGLASAQLPLQPGPARARPRATSASITRRECSGSRGEGALSWSSCPSAKPRRPRLRRMGAFCRWGSRVCRSPRPEMSSSISRAIPSSPAKASSIYSAG